MKWDNILNEQDFFFFFLTSVRLGVRKLFCIGEIQPASSFDIFWNAAMPINLLLLMATFLLQGSVR